MGESVASCKIKLESAVHHARSIGATKPAERSPTGGGETDDALMAAGRRESRVRSDCPERQADENQVSQDEKQQGDAEERFEQRHFYWPRREEKAAGARRSDRFPRVFRSMFQHIGGQSRTSEYHVLQERRIPVFCIVTPRFIAGIVQFPNPPKITLAAAILQGLNSHH
eukprot:3326378-Rhodomonas_salina.1